MNKGQTRGMIAIVIGFVITILAGIVFSFLAVGSLTSSQLIIAAVLVFLFVSPIFAYGVFTYARSTEAEAYATNDDMEKPRQLLDILRENGQSKILNLAAQLETSPDAIKAYIDDLSQLELFSGIVNWESGEIEWVNPIVIEAIERCKTCQNAIMIADNVTICPQCGTEYYKI